MRGEIASVRRSALVLARMSLPDRKLALEQISAEKRVQIQRELVGLQNLGINAEVINALSLEAPSAQFKRPDSSEGVEADINLLNSVNPARLREMLAVWPAKLRIAFLNAAAWTWADPATEMLPGSAAKLTPKASESLIRAASQIERERSQ